jgi:hypothetical protein
LVAAVAFAVVAAACATSPPASPQATDLAPSPSPTIGSPPSVSIASSPPPASGLAASPSSSAGGSGQPTSPEPGLFALIGGDSKNGLTFRYDPDTTARVAVDPGLAADATALAIGLYTVTGQDPVADFAIVSIIRLRDPKPTDAWFRTYRDSYDASACAAAGGVARHAQTELAGRTVFIAGCAGGAFTYHVVVPAHAAVVSITAVGPGRLGERLAKDIEN